MNLFPRWRTRHMQYELVRRQNDIYTVTDLAIAAHTAIGTERQAAAHQVHGTVQAAHKMLATAGPSLSPERKQAIHFRLMAYCYEVLDSTNQVATRLIARSRR